ncbi:MAG: helix-turn-helix domain-containing protein [Eubacterium sp.]|nr:helix-turn-helix domain-containing protein [Eubacterium sp.]
MVYVENELIGRRLQDIRESAHMGFYDMAKLLGVSEGHYRKIERGIYGLDVPKLVTLYEKLDVDPLYLLAGSQKGKNANLSHSEIRRRRVCELLDYCRKQIGEDVEV